jgi:putative adhesin Stv-like protein
MARVFICGHGGWGPKDGYTFVPKGSSIIFYTAGGHTMRSSDVGRLLKGTYAGKPDCSLGSFRSCPDMRLYPDDADCKAESEQNKPDNAELYFTNVPGGVKLSQIFGAKPNSEFVWACCRAYALSDSGKGDTYGMRIARVESATGYGRIENGVFKETHTKL